MLGASLDAKAKATDLLSRNLHHPLFGLWRGSSNASVVVQTIRGGRHRISETAGRGRGGQVVVVCRGDRRVLQPLQGEQFHGQQQPMGLRP